MKKTYIVIVVVILVIAGLWFLVAKSKKAEAPTVDTSTASLGNENTDMGDMDMNQPMVGAYQPPTTTQPVQNGDVKEFVVTAQNFSFTPSLITVKKGDKVKITFKNTSGFHDFKLDEFGLATKQAQSPYEEVLQFTADKTGSFQYYCSVGTHRSMGMWGTLKVE